MDSDRRRGERGSAMVIAILVTVVLSMLGLTFLMLSETENRIARNERRQAQALYVGESAARIVKRWFDHPETAIHFPANAEVDRTLRMILDETDPYGGTPTAADGVLGSFPYYKQGVDADADSEDDLLERPYRATADPLLHMFMGTEDGPDLRIDEADAGATSYLIDLSNTLFGNFPDAASGFVARVSRIDVYAPPYIEVSGTWSRYGLATVKVVARIYGPDGEVAGEREVRAVLSEIPYRGPYGPLHSCADTSLVPLSGSPVTAHWGALTTALDLDLMEPGDATIDQCLGRGCMPVGLPRDLPNLPREDSIWDFNGVAADWLDWRADTAGDTVFDPWLRVITEKRNDGQSGVSYQYEGPDVDTVSPPTPVSCCNHSHLTQRISLTTCPLYDYATWKSIATSGRQDVRYFTWVSGDQFRENGSGVVASFRQLTDGREGLYFFDTRDLVAPRDDNGDTSYDNLTPAIRLAGGTWSFRGFLFVNAESIQFDGVGGVAMQVLPPGEPYVDQDADGEYDAGELFVELDYPPDLATDFILRDTSPAPPRRDRGDPINANVSFGGILYTNGTLLADGSALLYGSVIAREGVEQSTADGTLDTPDIYWDQSIVDGWPPAGWQVPRVAITSWIPER